MGGSVTVSLKSIALAGVVALALVTAYLLGGSGDPVTAPASAAPEGQVGQPDRRMVRMSGTGEATAVPDQLSFGLTVTAKRLDLDEALSSSSATMKRVLAVLGQYGVKEAEVQTTGLTMYPEYDYHAYGPPTLTGYRVSQRAKVRVNELSQGGKAISAAVDSGGNGVRVRDIRLEVAEPDVVLAQARDAAVASATAKAEQYAAATGQSLGDVVSIRELGSTPRYAPQRTTLTAYRDLAKNATLPIRAGKDDLEVRVEVVWSFA